MRFIPEPSAESVEARQALAQPFPFIFEGSEFLERMLPDVRRETLCALDARLRTWLRATENIETLLVNEIMYRLDPQGGFKLTIESFNEIKQDPKLHWLVKERNLLELDTVLDVPFPVSATSSSFDDFQPVPPTPYLLDDDDFDNTGSDTDSDDCPMELV